MKTPLHLFTLTEVQMLLAELEARDWVQLIGFAITLIVSSVIGVYFLFRHKRTEANIADDAATLTTRKENMALDAAALQKHIDDLRAYNVKLQDQMSVIQNQTLQKIIDAHDEHHKCEQKFNDLRDDHTTLQADHATLQQEHEAMKAEFEGRLEKLEGRPK